LLECRRKASKRGRRSRPAGRSSPRPRGSFDFSSSDGGFEDDFARGPPSLLQHPSVLRRERSGALIHVGFTSLQPSRPREAKWTRHRIRESVKTPGLSMIPESILRCGAGGIWSRSQCSQVGPTGKQLPQLEEALPYSTPRFVQLPAMRRPTQTSPQTTKSSNWSPIARLSASTNSSCCWNQI
jgi:hypothetical protein